jgi:N-glycosylase/DNA lyase
MWTALEESLINARASVVGDISLFLAGQGEERTQTFLQFWNGLLERDILMEPPTAKSEFIWRLIESVMARVRTIAAAAPAEQNRSLH